MKVVGHEVIVFRIRVKAVRYMSTPRASFSDISKFTRALQLELKFY